MPPRKIDEMVFTKVQTLRLWELYQESTQLWNISSPDYFKKDKQNRALTLTTKISLSCRTVEHLCITNQADLKDSGAATYDKTDWLVRQTCKIVEPHLKMKTEWVSVMLFLSNDKWKRNHFILRNAEGTCIFLWNKQLMS